MTDKPMSVSWYTLAELKEGLSFSFEEFVSTQSVDDFVKLSGDVSPLHVSDEYAKKSGYPGRVVHGVLSMAYISRLIGVHLPGGNSIISNINLKFRNPVIVNSSILITGTIKQVAESVGVVVVGFTVESLDRALTYATGDVTVKVRE